MARTQLGVELTQVDTTKQFPLGFEFERQHPTEDYGLQVWVYVYNDEASSSFVEGSVVARDASTATKDGILAPASTPSHRVIGVAQHTIEAGSYGWILRRGIGEVEAGTGSIDDDEGLVVDTTDAGHAMEFGSIAEAQDAAGTEHGISGPFGVALEDAAVGVLATCWIDCRG